MTYLDPVFMKLSYLVAWLRTRDPAEKYDYCNARACMLALYFTAVGLSDVVAGPSSVVSRGTFIQDLPRFFDNISQGILPGVDEEYEGLWTMGAARRRAEIYLELNPEG